jgi:hypothetical protein
MDLRICLSNFEFDGINIAVPMDSKANVALARAVPYCDTISRTDGFLIECDESEARDMLKHVALRYPSMARTVLDALRERNITP